MIDLSLHDALNKCFFINHEICFCRGSSNNFSIPRRLTANHLLSCFICVNWQLHAIWYNGRWNHMSVILLNKWKSLVLRLLDLSLGEAPTRWSIICGLFLGFAKASICHTKSPSETLIIFSFNFSCKTPRAWFVLRSTNTGVSFLRLSSFRVLGFYYCLNV